MTNPLTTTGASRLVYLAWAVTAVCVAAVLIAFIYFPLQKAHRGEQNKLQYRTACLDHGGAIIRNDCVRPFGTKP